MFIFCLYFLLISKIEASFSIKFHINLCVDNSNIFYLI